MNQQYSQNRMVWLAAGVVFGLGIGWLWPHEPAQSAVTDRNENFAMLTTDVQPLLASEAVFVLDFLTGRLHGAVLNPRSGKFTNFYFYNMSADFLSDPQANPKYSIVAGRATLTGRAGSQMATSILYVGELTSGRVGAYAFPYKDTNAPLPPSPLVLLDNFPFREKLKE